jgi:hypothetical protein
MAKSAAKSKGTKVQYKSKGGMVKKGRGKS